MVLAVEWGAGLLEVWSRLGGEMEWFYWVLEASRLVEWERKKMLILLWKEERIGCSQVLWMLSLSQDDKRQ